MISISRSHDGPSTTSFRKLARQTSSQTPARWERDCGQAVAHRDLLRDARLGFPHLFSNRARPEEPALVEGRLVASTTKRRATKIAASELVATEGGPTLKATELVASAERGAPE